MAHVEHSEPVYLAMQRQAPTKMLATGELLLPGQVVHSTESGIVLQALYFPEAHTEQLQSATVYPVLQVQSNIEVLATGEVRTSRQATH